MDEINFLQWLQNLSGFVKVYHSFIKAFKKYLVFFISEEFGYFKSDWTITLWTHFDYFASIIVWNCHQVAYYLMGEADWWTKDQLCSVEWTGSWESLKAVQYSL